MPERAILNRAVLVKKMDEIDPKKPGLIAKVSKMYSVIFAFAGPTFPLQEMSISPLPRQYSCYRNAVRNIYYRRFVDAWWEIYDFVTASEDEDMTFAEMWLLTLVLGMMEDEGRKANEAQKTNI